MKSLLSTFTYALFVPLTPINKSCLTVYESYPFGRTHLKTFIFKDLGPFNVCGTICKVNWDVRIQTAKSDSHIYSDPTTCIIKNSLL